MAIGLGSVQADDFDYPYLLFTSIDGTQTTLSVTELEMTFLEGKLVAVNGDGTTTLSLDDLASMQFSTTGVVATKTACDLALNSDTTAFSATLGDDFTAPSLTNPHNLTVTWTSSDEQVAIVAEDGSVTIVGTGTATITASFDGDENYKAGSVAYTLTVDEPDAIQQLSATTAVRIYTPTGILVGSFDSEAQAKASLTPGLYVVNVGNKNHKLLIR